MGMIAFSGLCASTRQVKRWMSMNSFWQTKSIFRKFNLTFPLTFFWIFKGPSDVVMIDSLLRSLCLDEAGEEVDEDDAEGEGEDVHDKEGKRPPV